MIKKETIMEAKIENLSETTKVLSVKDVTNDNLVPCSVNSV